MSECETQLQWLYGTQFHGIKLGLENTWRLVRALGIDLGRMQFLHVAGTNGKGSVCAMLAAITQAAGYKTGLFTSPHLITFRERIRIDGAMIGEAEVASRLAEIRALVQDWQYSPTFFEITTALALAHFQEHGADVVVLETGLGGRLDATNIVTARVSVLTSIDLDHQQYLGNTIAAIAAEKAGIIKPGVPVVSAPQHAEATEVIKLLAAERLVRLEWVDQPLENVPIALAGSHQRWNAALAVRALEKSGLKVPPEAIRAGLATVQWPGRFQRVNERLVLDGAHNPAAAEKLVTTWREVFGEMQATLVLGVLADKDARSICARLLPLAARVITVPVRNPRSTTATDLAAMIQDIDPDFPCWSADNLAHALEVAQTFPEPVLVAGSLFLVGEMLARLERTDVREVSAQ